ncbi:hypothetical protein F4808DRAFT_12902 [Astrocystis sublimbata]|nr:hypothetical protein F4808DRAFT_12902 [Astrocystis sublimbata]
MTLSEPPGLQQLPYELVLYIADDLEIEDIFNWSLCSKHFEYLIREDRFCMRVVTSKVPASLETREALQNGAFARALRRIVKRRDAISRASPYVVGIIARAESYKFLGGKLCYITTIDASPSLSPNRWLRMIDVHGPTDWELAVSIPMLIRASLPESVLVRAIQCRKYKFKILYQAEGIVSCLYSFALPHTEHWLLIFKPQTQQVIDGILLPSTRKLFVRNNADYLYYGTHSLTGADGFRKWVLKGYDLDKCSHFDYPGLYLSDMAGSDIGSTACFEIFGGYLYGLSNQRLFEADNPDWTSHYYCFRVPLNTPIVQNMEVMNDEYSWRRMHSEGPLDERWGFLSLEKDESNGSIVILECRKEWLNGGSTSYRMYYTTEVVFCQQSIQQGQERVRAATARRIGDRPQSDTPIPSRRSDYVHAGDDSSVASLLVRSKTFFSTYIRSCHTFVDLIEDTSMGSVDHGQLRLRTGYRRLEPESRIVMEKSALDETRTPSEDPNQPSMQPSQANTIYIWPPEQETLGPDPSLDEVQRLLKGDGQRYCVVAADGDDRSIIYAAADSVDSKEQKALVLLSFDPATRFESMEYGGDIVGQRTLNEPKEKVNSLSATPTMVLQSGPNVHLGAMYEGKSSEVDVNPSSGQAAPASYAGLAPPPCVPGPPKGIEAWVSYQKAMQSGIRRTCFFSRSPRVA